MAEQQPVTFEQQASLSQLFGAGDGSPINQFITGLERFGNNVNIVAESLIGFLEYAKFILKTLRDPLALVLIPLLDALIAELEDLKNIGLGSLTVWPWECGNLAAPVDTSKLEEGLDALAFYLLPDTEKKNKELIWNPTSGYGLVEKKNKDKSKLSRVDDLVANPQSTNIKSVDELGESKHFLLDMARGVREFLDPSTWEGPYEEGVATFLEGLKTGLNKRQLTPQQTIDKIIDSFGDSNDQLRPTGKGDYQAMILMFTLPSMSDLNQLVTAFSDYFGGVLSRNFKEGSDKSTDSDAKRLTIELGPPLIFDVETSYDIEKRIRNKNIEIDSLSSQLPLDDITVEEIRELEEEISELKEDLDDIRKSGSKESKNSIFFMNNVKINKNILKDGDGKPLNLLIDKDNPAPDWFPIFKKGDNIVQGRSTTFGPSFEAKVIKHGPIQISNGKIIRNTLTVQGVRGKIQKNRSTRGVGSAGVIRRMNVLKDEQMKKTLITGGPSAEEVLRKIPLYQPAGAIISEPVPADVKFIGTIKEGNNLIDHILPVTLGTAGANEALSEILREARDLSGSEDFIIASYEDGGPGGAFQRPRGRLKKIETEMISFLESLSIGLVVRQTYLNTGEWKLPEEIGEATSDVSVNLKKLASALPGFGINYHVGEIFIKDSVTGTVKEFIPGRAKEMLFKRNPSTKEVVSMNVIQIKLGRLIGDGSYETQGTAMKPFINVSGDEKKFYEFNQKDKDGQIVTPFETFRFSGGRPPNWKFIRIQDFLPAYGTFIDEAISLIERGKGYVQSGMKFLDNIIERLQDEIDAIKEFNKTIQQLIQLLSLGFNGAGFYTLNVSGNGGVNDFKKKLGRAKFLQKTPSIFPELSLETTKESFTEVNPFTGLEEEKFITGMKPVLKTPEELGQKGPRIVSPSELNNLKYSGAVVFYGQGNDSKGLAAWLKQLEATRTLGMSFIGNILGTGDTFAEKLRPKIDRVLVQDKDGNFFNSDDNTKKAKFDTTIRIVIKNEAHTLTKEERDTFQEVQGREIDFSPTIITSTLNVTNSDDAINTSGDVFCLYKGDSPSDTNCVQLQDAFRTSLNVIGTHNENEVHEFIIDLIPKEQSLPASNDNEPTYKLHIIASPMTSERLKLDKRKTREGQPGRDDLAFNSAVGFKIEKTSILSLELNNAI